MASRTKKFLWCLGLAILMAFAGIGIYCAVHCRHQPSTLPPSNGTGFSTLVLQSANSTLIISSSAPAKLSTLPVSAKEQVFRSGLTSESSPLPDAITKAGDRETHPSRRDTNPNEYDKHVKDKDEVMERPPRYYHPLPRPWDIVTTDKQAQGEEKVKDRVARAVDTQLYEVHGEAPKDEDWIVVDEAVSDME